MIISKKATVVVPVLSGPRQEASTSDQQFHHGIVQLRPECFDSIVLPGWMDAIG
jgi:hypothetical protein